MKIERDSSEQDFIEVPLLGTEGQLVRVTLVPESKSWAGKPTLRVQVHEPGSPPRPGPEVPIDTFGAVVADAMQLLASRLGHGTC